MVALMPGHCLGGKDTNIIDEVDNLSLGSVTKYSTNQILSSVKTSICHLLLQ